MSDIPAAANIDIVGCARGNVTIRLYDRAGKVFATATMPAATARTAGENMHIEARLAEALQAGGAECAGHA